MHLFPGKIRIRDVYLNDKALTTLQMRKAKESTCCRISYIRYKITIDNNFTIKHDTSVFHGSKHIGFMIRSEEDKVVLKGGGCTSVEKVGMICSICKKVKTLIQNLKRKHPTPQQKMLTEDTNVDQPAPDGELFQRLKAKLQHPICKWQGCEDKGEEFNDISELVDHVKEHVAPPQLNTAPCDRAYICEWQGCRKSYKKRKLLLSHITEMHTGTKFITKKFLEFKATMEKM